VYFVYTFMVMSIFNSVVNFLFMWYNLVYRRQICSLHKAMAVLTSQCQMCNSYFFQMQDIRRLTLVMN